MIHKIRSEIISLKNHKDVKQKTLSLFLNRLNKNLPILQTFNPKNHFCCFFLPFDIKNKQIFLVNHKKANDWIPPGGHMEENETPLETIKRESFEELKYSLTDEKIEIFNLSIKKINKKNQLCKIHYDLWYKVSIDKTDFSFDKKEFYETKWVSLEKAKKIVKTKCFNEVIQRISFL